MDPATNLDSVRARLEAVYPGRGLVFLEERFDAAVVGVCLTKRGLVVAYNNDEIMAELVRTNPSRTLEEIRASFEALVIQTRGAGGESQPVFINPFPSGDGPPFKHGRS